MEERNIFWGELVGGLLMVGCSVALVIYLWKDLEKIAYFKFLIFVGTTALVFGAGLYSLYRLKLQTTSRGLFVIAMLLVPLNFLVMAGLSEEERQAEPALRITTELLALGIFAGLMAPASQALMPDGSWALLLAVLGISVSPLAVPRFFTPDDVSLWRIVLLGGLPVFWYVASADVLLSKMTRRESLQETQAKEIFAFLGLAAFPLIVALGFLVYWTGQSARALQELAVHVALAGIPFLAGGLIVQRRLAVPPGPNGESIAALRTVATAVALAGMAVMLLAVALAWPWPVGIILVCTLNFVALTSLAFVYDMPSAHAVALASLAAGYLTAVHFFLGHLEVPEDALGMRLWQQSVSIQSGSALVFLAFAVGAAAGLLVHVGRASHARFYAAGGGILALASLAIVTLRGTLSPATAALVTGLYAATCLALSFRWRRPLFSYVGLALVLPTTLWSLWWYRQTVTPAWGTTLAVEALVMALLARLAGTRLPTPHAWRDLSLVAGVMAFALSGTTMSSSAGHSCTAGMLALNALVLAWLYGNAVFTWAGSLLILAALLHAFAWAFSEWHLQHPLLLAFLIHASLVFVLSFSFKTRWLVSYEPAAANVIRIFSEPLRHSAIISSLIAVPFSLALAWQEMAMLTVYWAWLSAIWFGIALTNRRPGSFALFQGVLTLTVIFGVTAWLELQPWLAGRQLAQYLDPRSLQAYGIGLAGLSLLWIVIRLALRSRALAQALLEPPWPGVDRVVLGIVVLGQLALAVHGIFQGLKIELGGLAAGSVPLYLYGPGAWALLALLAFVLVIALWDRQPGSAVLGLLILASAVPVLIAARFDSDRAFGPALRLGFSVCFLACSALLWARNSISALAAKLHSTSQPEIAIDRAARRLLLALTVLPVLGLTAAFAGACFSGQPLVEPLPQSVFARIGWITSTVAPLILISVAMAGHALREPSASYAFCAGLVTNAAVLTAYALGILTAQQTFGPDEPVRLLQLGTLTAALWTLLWLSGMRWLTAMHDLMTGVLGRALTAIQLSMAVLGNVVLLAWPLIRLLLRPQEALPGELLAVGQLWGWLAFFLTGAGVFWYAGLTAPRQRGNVLAAFGLGLGILAGCSAGRLDVMGEWLAYHVLTAAWVGTGLAILAAEHVAKLHDDQTEAFSPFPLIARFLRFSAGHYRSWLNLIGVLVLGLALRSTWEDPFRPYWPAGATLAVSAMAAAVALRSRQQAYVYFSGLLINVAGGMVWVVWGEASAFSFGYTQVLCFALAAGLWSTLETGLRVYAPDLALTSRFPRYRHVAIIIALVLLALLIPCALFVDAAFGAPAENLALPWLALGTVAVVLAMLFWDRETKFSLAGLYVVGLVTIGLIFHTLQLRPQEVRWVGVLALAAFVLLVNGLVWAAPWLRQVGREFRLPPWPEREPEDWVIHTQTLLTGVVAILSSSLAVPQLLDLLHEPVGDGFVGSLAERAAAPLAVALLLPAAVLLAQAAPTFWGKDLRAVPFVLGLLLLTEIGWVSVINPADYTAWLQRNAILMTASALLTLLYGTGLPRLIMFPPAWAESSRRMGALLGVLASAVLLVVLGQEAWFYDPDTRRTGLPVWAIASVAAALVGLITAGICFAVVPRKDPLGLSERRRVLYVYGGEVLLLLLGVHLRLTVPEIFELGIVVRYWNFLIMALAFLGVGLSEFFSRRGLRVLVEPLQRTGVFLPLLPVLTFWVIPLAQARQEQLADPDPYGKYAILWFLVGALYTVVALNRRSSRYALFAALAANAGLWAFLFYTHLQFLTHPQMWLIPLALIMLVSEHLNRDRLSEEQSGALRYLALLILYVSSTADMYIIGLGNSVIWPLVLAILSIVGVLAGILLRVRAFLYLGVTFLFVVIFSMIWHAAVGQGQMWLWWVSGIVLGAGIIALFAVFEQRRNDVLRMLEEMRKWD